MPELSQFPVIAKDAIPTTARFSNTDNKRLKSRNEHNFTFPWQMIGDESDLIYQCDLSVVRKR